MVQTSDGTKVGQCKRQTGTNFGLVQTSDWDKRCTGTNFGLVQTSDQQKRQMVQRSDSVNVGLVQISDWYKRRTGINVGPAETSFGYIYKEKRRTLVEFEKRPLL